MPKRKRLFLNLTRYRIGLLNEMKDEAVDSALALGDKQLVADMRYAGEILDSLIKEAKEFRSNRIKEPS